MISPTQYHIICINLTVLCHMFNLSYFLKLGNPLFRIIAFKKKQNIEQNGRSPIKEQLCRSIYKHKYK